MTILAVDFGGTYTKAVKLNDEGKMEQRIELPSSDPTSFLEHHITKNTSQIIITGGRSKQLPDEIRNIEIIKVNEFEAMSQVLLDTKRGPGLVVSLGTGTACIMVKENRGTHIGGTGVGGGTIVGLGSRLLEKNLFNEIEEIARNGDSSKVNITVGDIIGSGIGMLSAEATASNFGKLGGEDEDIAAGLFSLVGETIGVIVANMMQANKINKAYFIGKTAESAILKQIIEAVLSLYGLNSIFVDDPTYMCVYGAISVASDYSIFN